MAAGGTAPDGTRVLLDVRPLTGLQGPMYGIPRYVRALAGALPAMDGSRAYAYFTWPSRFRRWQPRVPTGLSSVRPVPSMCSPVPTRWLAAINHGLNLRSPRMFSGPARIFHSFAFSPPFFRSVATIATVHDVTYLRHPEVHGGFADTIHQAWRRVLPHCDAVITVSHQSKADIAASYNYPPERIHVIYNWVADELTQAPTGDESPALNGRPYILTVAAVKPHKNLLTALDAIATLGPAVPHDYVIAGHTDVEPRYTELLRRRAADLGIEQQLHLVGAVDDQTLASLYRGADLLLLPSLYEGFGYPLIEAMHFGVPIVTANTGSLPEVAQCAALAVSPTDARAMAEAVEAALTDGSLRARLVAAGRRRGEQFTKERAVAGVLDVYRLLEGAPSPV